MDVSYSMNTALDSEFAQQVEDACQHRLEIEPRVVDFLEPRRAQVSTAVARVLDHDRIR